jgi:RNase P subunit RPR2
MKKDKVHYADIADEVAKCGVNVVRSVNILGWSDDWKEATCKSCLKPSPEQEAEEVNRIVTYEISWTCKCGEFDTFNSDESTGTSTIECFSCLKKSIIRW